MRAVPTASKGFIAATSRKPGDATTRPRRGTCSSASLITVMRTFSVSSGMRLISSTYSSEPSCRADTSGPSTNTSGAYPSVITRAGSKCPTSRAGVSSAFPSTNSKPMPSSSATARRSVDFPVPGRTLEQDVPAGGERGHHQLELAPPADDVPAESVEQRLSRRR